jgi:hypothetical protein
MSKKMPWSKTEQMKISNGNVAIVRAKVTFYVDLAVATDDCDEALQEIADMGHLVQDLSVQGNPCDGFAEGVAYGLLEDELDTERVRIWSWGFVGTDPTVVAQTQATAAFPQGDTGGHDDD